MSGHRLEVADVFRKYETQYFEQYGDSMSIAQKRVFRAICDCRTSALGGRKHRCDQCGSECIVYNACRDRHCPRCQSKARADWTDAREAELLSISYFHVVFTMPHDLGPLALQNQKVVYDILFRAAAETLKQLSADPKHLGAEIGVLAVLHTWGQTLMHHGHVHCIVSGGGLSFDKKRWVPCKSSRRNKKKFFIHVKVLGRVFRGKFVDYLWRAFDKGKLKFHGELAAFDNPLAFKRFLKLLPYNWVVYAKRPFRETSQIVRYLARYTHRVAITNSRLLEVKDDRVHFSYKDYADDSRKKTMELDATEFIRRFLLHVLPLSFVKIRYFGFLSNRFRKEKLDQCRKLLGMATSTETNEDSEVTSEEHLQIEMWQRCPHCNVGILVLVEIIPKDADLEFKQRRESKRAPPIRRAG